MAKKSDEIKAEIIEEIGTISTTDKGVETKLTLTSWNGNAAKYDIRPWKDDRGYKGITLSKDEVIRLYEILDENIEEIRKSNR